MSNHAQGLRILALAICCLGARLAANIPTWHHFTQQTDRAVLSIQSATRDLGVISEVREWDVPFTIQNAGGRRLVINEQNTACNCGNTRPRCLVIEPGSSQTIRLKLDPRAAHGPIESAAAFNCNDPGNPQFVLRVKAFVPATMGNALPETSSVDRR